MENNPKSDSPRSVRQAEDKPSSFSTFWAELRRRKVIRVAIVYVVVAWSLIEIADTLFPIFGIPIWGKTFVTLLLAIGFPIAMIFAWAFQLTADGIKSEVDVPAGQVVVQGGGNKLNNVILGFIALALVFLIGDRFLFDRTSSHPVEKPSVTNSGVKRTVINLEEDQEIALADMMPAGVGRRNLALSPDGTHLAYIAKVGESTQLYLRRMDAFEAQPLKGTEGAFHPFFSPDGKWIGFLKQGKLMKISIRGGTPQTLTDANQVYGADWGPDDTIIFVERANRRLSRISADGGEKQEIVSGTFEDPEFLPDGNGILLRDYEYSQSNIVLYRMDTGETVTLIEGGAGPRYVSTGHIVYTNDGGVSAVPFDLSTYTFEGSSVPVFDDVRIEAFGLPQLDFSEDGLLTYIPGPDLGLTTPVWVDRNGVEETIPLPRQRYAAFGLSPDNSQAAFLIRGQEGNDVWLYDFERATPPRQLTHGGYKTGVTWSPDGNSIAFAAYSNSDRNRGIYHQSINGSQASLIMEGDARNYSPNSWVIENLLLYNARNDFESDLWIASMDSTDEPQSLVATSSNEWGAFMSPDGRFFAYVSNESGQNQIYVKQYPPTEARWQVSAGFGKKPVWPAEGDEIFFLGRNSSQWLSVPVTTDPEFTMDVPSVVIAGPYANVLGLSYNVTSDGQRFLMQKPEDQPTPNKLHIVTNWFEELERLVPSEP